MTILISKIGLNVRVSDKIAKLYKALSDNGYNGEPLRKLMIRLLFLLFAEDTGILEKDDFVTLLEECTDPDGSNTGTFLLQLFNVLDTAPAKRQKNLPKEMLDLRWVNGDLFTDPMPPPAFDRQSRKLLIDCCEIRWSEISPAIFGSLFQKILEEESGSRRQKGVHYTDEKNVEKLIHGLFLNDLYAEYDEIFVVQDQNRRLKVLRSFHDKLAKLKFLDPACGCGNFLIIAYRELRRLEHRVIISIKELTYQVPLVGLGAQYISRVNVNQFFGIELDNTAAKIAEVAMYITDHQMNRELSEQIGELQERLPLQEHPNIRGGVNALHIDWSGLCIPNFILGNPPFVGKSKMNEQQKADMDLVMARFDRGGHLDYVTCWYVKAWELMIKYPDIRCAFVSTSSITQGQQVSILWPPLIRQGLEIYFAHRTFVWANEAITKKAAVHCVIIGFATAGSWNRQKTITDYSHNEDPFEQTVRLISPYLIEYDPSFVISERRKPICVETPAMINGSKPADGGHLIFTEVERNAFLTRWPEAEPFMRRLIGTDEVLYGYFRWCLWLKDIDPSQYRHIRGIMDRLTKVRDERLKSTKVSTVRDASRPMEFQEIRQSTRKYVWIPRHFSEHRLYAPFAYIDPAVIASDATTQLPDANLFVFGLLNSAMHMSFARQVCGRLESRYRYSNAIIWNNFPWPREATTRKISTVEEESQNLLEIRKSFLERGNTYADIYDSDTMPPILLKAHHQLDRAVDLCYRKNPFISEGERVRFLFKLHQQYTRALNMQVSRQR